MNFIICATLILRILFIPSFRSQSLIQLSRRKMSIKMVLSCIDQDRLSFGCNPHLPADIRLILHIRSESLAFLGKQDCKQTCLSTWTTRVRLRSQHIVFFLFRIHSGSLIHSWRFSKKQMMASGSWSTGQRYAQHARTHILEDWVRFKAISTEKWFKTMLQNSTDQS